MHKFNNSVGKYELNEKERRNQVKIINLGVSACEDINSLGHISKTKFFSHYRKCYCFLVFASTQLFNNA